MVKSKKEEKTLSILAHVLGIVAGFIPSLVIFLFAEDGYTKKNSMNALNWQISLVIYMVASVFLMILLVGFFLVPALYILNIIFSIIAAVRAKEGRVWEYPLTIKFI